MSKTLLAGASALLLAACTASHRPGPAPDAPAGRLVAERWVSAESPGEELDSIATWVAADGRTWLVATGKSTHRLSLYDGETGELLRTVGRRGQAPGEFERPNGVTVAGDVLFVVERDNRRVQALRLPGFTHVTSFAGEDLAKPYGLWVNPVDAGYELYVTDAYMAGEDAGGEDILPPLSGLDRRVKRYLVKRDGAGYRAQLVSAFGDTSERGALRVVESIWGDPLHGRLLIPLNGKEEH